MPARSLAALPHSLTARRVARVVVRGPFFYWQLAHTLAAKKRNGMAVAAGGDGGDGGGARAREEDTKSLTQFAPTTSSIVFGISHV